MVERMLIRNEIGEINAAIDGYQVAMGRCLKQQVKLVEKQLACQCKIEELKQERAMLQKQLTEPVREIKLQRS